MIRKTQFIDSCLMFGVYALCTSAAHAFDAPKDPRGTEVGQSTVKWEWARVNEADMYEVVVDGTHVGLTRDPQYFSYNLWAGEHSLTVRAMRNDGRYSERTPTVKIQVSDWFSASNPNRSHVVGQVNQPTVSVVTQPVQPSQPLSAPADTRGTIISTGLVKWEWSSVSGATSYDITVDGGYVGSTSDTSFESHGLWEGDHSMSVVATNSQGNTSPRSDTAKVRLSSEQVAANTPTPAPPPPQTASAPPPPAGNPDAANVRSMVDPSSFTYDEVYQKTGYDLVFSDEFNGTALNPFRWNTGLRWDGEYNGERYEYRVVNGEDQFYVNIFSEDEEHIRDIAPVYNPFEFDGDRLAIRAVKNPLKNHNSGRAYGSLREMSTQQAFLSGAITTHDKFSQKYGYFEARIKIPNHVGSFPAFWLFHENRVWEGTQRSEIDIMENLGHAPWYIYNSFHYFKNVSTSYNGDAHFVKPYPSGQVYTGTDFSQNFHVYAVEWEPGKVSWFIDGEKVSELHHGEVNHEELYVKLNLAIGGNWTNYPTNSGGLGRSPDQHFPNQDDLNNFNNPALEIDYVRVYRKR